LKRISIAILFLGLIAAAGAGAQTEGSDIVYRWVDADGTTRYGRTLPPEYANKPHEILNAAGVVLRQIDPSVKPEVIGEEAEEEAEPEEKKPLFSDREVRIRTDNLLMLRYHTEEDLVAAMENEIAQLGYDTRLIHQSQASVMTSLATQIKKAADLQRAGLPEDEKLTRQIYSLRKRLRDSEHSLAGLRERETNIRAVFLKNIERYRFLANGGTPGSEDIN
jgi:hypothetical protein